MGQYAIGNNKKQGAGCRAHGAGCTAQGDGGNINCTGGNMSRNVKQRNVSSYL